MRLIRSLILATALGSLTAGAAPINVLWWDTTPQYGGQATNALRQAMSNALTNFGGGGVFTSTYVDAELAAGTLATRLATNSYDVIVFDSTPSDPQNSFNAADRSALQTFYSNGRRNVMLDGTLYIRSINYNALTVYPGTNGALGGLTANQVMQIANRGGGVLIGTDHNCCQGEANSLFATLFTGAPGFSGFTAPTNVGTFFGSDLLNGGAAAIAAVDVFNHWDSVDSQAVTTTGNFTDFLGNARTMHSQVNVVDAGGGGLTAGVAYAYISTSWAPGAGTTNIDNPNPGGTGGGEIPEPATVGTLAMGLAALCWFRRRA